MKRELINVDGTVASVMNARLAEVDFDNMSLDQMKEAVIDILHDPAIKQKDLAEKYIREVSTKTNVGHLTSTIGTYLTGIKLGKSRGYTRKYS
jgi:hypothetical protein